MDQFYIYCDFQKLLLTMNGEEVINQCKNYINNKKLFKNDKKLLSTIRAIASVACARPELFENMIKLLMNYKSNLQHFKMSKKQTQTDKVAAELLNTCFNPDFYIMKRFEWPNFKITNIIKLSDPYIKSIYDDDVSFLQQLIYKNNYNINQKIQLFAKRERMTSLNEANILEISAYFGSINCFKFILMISDQVNYESLLEFSIPGGNYEIIHIVEKGIENPNGKSNPFLLYLAINYMRNDLIEYIIDNYDIEINAECYIQCILSSNFNGMLKLIEIDEKFEENINGFGKDLKTPIGIAAREGHLEFFKFFANMDEVIYDKLSYDEYTILQITAENRQLHIAKYIIKHDLEDPCYNENGEFTPFEWAYLEWREGFDCFSEKYMFYPSDYFIVNWMIDDSLDDYIYDNVYFQKYTKESNISKKNNLKSKIVKMKQKKKAAKINKIMKKKHKNYKLYE